MNKKIKNVLAIIENSGFEAYLVGGFVRDYLLGISSFDVDICTNALPKDLHRLFPRNTNSNNYGGFNLRCDKYNIDITTFRKELNYEKRKPTEVVYINSLEEDIKRRDFTINSVCMTSKEVIIDLVGGVNDINNHLVKMLGDVDSRLKEDPLRILRAIRFASTLDFNIDSKLDKGIKNNYELVSTLSNSRIKSELNKILLNKNYLKGLQLLKKYKILDILKIEYEDISYVNDICGMWAQLNTPINYAFTKQEQTNIIDIKSLIKKGIIDNESLYKYGLYINLVVAQILNVNQKDIHKMYNRLPIKEESDLEITNKEIIAILNIPPSKKIKDVQKELINKVLNNELKNSNRILKKYVMKWMIE